MARSSGLAMWLAFPGVDFSPILGALHLPGPNLWWISPWVGLVPLFLALPRLSARRAFFVSWQAGILFAAPCLVWLAGHVPVAGSFGILSSLFLIPYLALYWGLNGVLIRILIIRTPGVALLAIPALWTCSEWLQNHLLSGFGWLLLAHTQGENHPLMQIASYGGVYSVTFVIVCVNVALWVVVARKNRLARVGAATAAIAALVATHAWGNSRTRPESEAATSTKRIGVVQASIATEAKWDPRYRPFIWQEHAERTYEATNEGAEIVVWSESALGPYAFERDTEKLKVLSADVDAPIVIGTTYVSEPKNEEEELWYTNAVMVAYPDGRISEPYSKVHLTPFGEYLPLRKVLGFVLRFIAIISEFTPGSEYIAFDIQGVKIQPLICFETVFPHDVRTAVAATNPALIFHHTNVGWFGRTSMAEQDLVITRFRAIESGTPIVRAANVGISCFIDVHGQVTAIAKDMYGNRVHEPVTLVADVQPGAIPTTYKRFGDIFVLACALALAPAFFLCYIRARQAP